MEGQRSGVVVRCEAAAVAEKEAPESSAETFEYQAEVRILSFLHFCVGIDRKMMLGANSIVNSITYDSW